MTHQQTAALLASQTACMLVELEAMKATNAERAAAGHAPAYSEKAFLGLPKQYGVDWDSAITLLNGAGLE